MRKTILSLKHRALSLLVTTVMLLGAQSAFAALTYQVIAGDRNNGDNEGLPKLFDGDYGTKWGNGYSEGTPQYFIIKVSEAVAPEWYCLVTANDTQQYTDRNWKTWKIYGANFDSDEAATREAEGWTLVDSKENIGPDQLPAANFTEAFFDLSEKSTEKYLYFRLEIEACVGANPYMQMAEFFFGEEEKFNSISKSRYDAANAFEYPEYYQKNLATKYKAAVRSLRYAENIFEVAQYDKECKDLQAQINASGDAYQNYITVVNSVVSAAEDGKLNAEGTAKVAAYTGSEEIAPSKVPQAAGRWTFDNPNNLLAGTGAPTIVPVKSDAVTTPVDPAQIGIVPIKGPSDGNGAIAVPKSADFLLSTKISGEQSTTYSFLYDLKVEDVDGYKSLLQCDPTNTKDGGLFIKNNQLGRGGVFGYNGEIQTETWYRVLFVMEGEGHATLYVNGEKLADNGGNLEYTLGFFTLGKEALLFADEDGEEGLVDIAEIRFFDKSLTADEAKALGGVGEGEPAEFPNGNYPYILNKCLLTAGAINAEAKTVGGWVEAYSAIDLTEGYIDVTYTALSGVDGFGDAEHYSKLVDGDDYTKWCSGNGNYFIIIKASDAIVPTYYRLFTSGDTGNYPGRNWKTWQVFGGNFASDDAATREAEGWELIDDKQNSNVLPAASNTEVYVNLSNPSKTPYQYFKIEIKDPSGVMQMSELSFLNQANFYKARQDKVAEFEGVDLTQPIMESMKAEFSAALENLRAVTTLSDLGTAASKCSNLANQIKAANELFAKTGNVVLAGSTAWGEGENWVRLVDGDLTTKWGGGRSAEGAYLIFRTKDAQAPYFYTLVTGNDTEGSPDRNWADWTIYAANFASDAEATRDAEGWTVIAQEAGIGQDRLPGANFAHAHFDFTTTPVAEAYSYFRVEVPKSFDNGGNIQMTELIFKSAEDFPAVKEEIAKGMKDQLTAMGVTNVDAFIESLSYMKAPFDKIEAAETINQVYEAKAAFDKVITSLKAPEMAGGYYQIDTPEKLQWLAGAVKMGFQNAKAKLTADLDMGGTLVEGAPAEDSKLFTPIGITDIPFTGEFDGQGHVISNLVVNTGEDYAGLFGRIAGSAIVKNFIVDAGSYIGGNAFVGVIGGSQGGNGIIIDRIGMEGKVVAAAQNAGGIYGCNMGNPNATVSNCYVTGDVIGNRESGQVNGWLGGGRIENTWAIGGIEGVYNKAEGAGDGFYRGAPTVGGVLYSNALYRNATTQPYDEELAKSGAMTYALNGNKADGAWFQTLGEDLVPTLNATHKKVYAQPSEGFRCDGLPLGDITYTNDEVVPNIPDHEYEGYICKNCGQIDPEFAQRDGDGFYVLYDAQELSWFAAMVNSGNTTLNARLADDIDMANVAGFSPIGNQSNLYTGTFDGEFHTISNFTIEGGDYTGLFGVVGGGATIKNFVMKNASIKGNAFIGIIGGSNGGGTITIDALGFEGEAIGAAQNASAIIGVNMGSAAAFTISNCYVIGKVQGARESAAITGWTGGSQSTITNCWSTAEVSGNDAGKAFYRNDGTVWSNCFNQYGEQVAAIPEGSLADGSMTWLLNGESEEGVWKQTLGVDENPTLDQTHAAVVKVGDRFMNKKGDALQIASVADLFTFAEVINNGVTVNAELTGDIDLIDLTPVTIGTAANPFKGKFDGKGFAIKNFNQVVSGDDGGLFGQVVDAEICNFSISGELIVHAARNGAIAFANGDSYIHDITSTLNIEATEGSKITHTAGIVGDAQGATTIKRCTYSGSMVVGNYNDCFAGIAGYINTARIEDCLFCGNIEFADKAGYVGGIVGYINNDKNRGIVNCLSVGNVHFSGEGDPQYGGAIVGRLRSWNADAMGNNFWLEGTANGGSGEKTENKFQSVTSEELKSGKVAVALGKEFRQNIGEDAYPVLDPTHAYVKEITEVGYATLYLPDDVEIPEGITAYIGEIVGDLLWIKPLSSSVIWDNFAVVLKGAPGYYNFKPVELNGEGGVRNALQGADEDIQADGSQYVLAQKNGVVGFYKAEGTIAAGKAYLTGGANVKGFALSFDGETGIADAVAEKTVESNAIYDLSGRRVEKAVKGIYIINGKKVLK